MKRRAIPLTRIYRRTMSGRAVSGCTCCVAQCDGTCATAAVLLCCFGLSDSPWTKAVESVRDASEDGALLAAAAMALTFGIDQGDVMPLVRSRICNAEPIVVVERLKNIVGKIDGCVVIPYSGGPRAHVAGHDLWAAVVRPGGHWVAMIRAGATVWMIVRFTVGDDECDTVVVDDCDWDESDIMSAHGLHFYYLKSQYKL